MSEDVFELMIIFFELTNLLVIFQAIINNLLKDITEIGDVATFIDDIMVGIKIEKKHNDIMKEVLRRMIENNLFVKLEIYIQKIKKVRFFRVIIKPKRVKIEKEKV